MKNIRIWNFILYQLANRKKKNSQAKIHESIRKMEKKNNIQNIEDWFLKEIFQWKKNSIILSIGSQS